MKKIKRIKKQKKSFFNYKKLIIFVPVLALIVYSLAKAQEQTMNDIVLRSAQEGRLGGSVAEPNPLKVQFPGSRWIANPLDYYNETPVRRSMEYIFGVDPENIGRTQYIKSDIEKLRDEGIISDEDMQYYQKIGDSFVSVNNDSQNGSGGQVLAANTQGAENWSDFMNIFQIKPKDGVKPAAWNSELFVRLVTQNAAAGIDRTLAALPDSGGNLPQFSKDDVTGANNSSTSTSITPSGDLNRVARSAGEMSVRQASVVNTPRDIALNSKAPLSPVSVSDPATKLPPPTAGENEQARIKSTAFGNEQGDSAGGLGRNSETLGYTRGPLYGQNILDQSVMDNLNNALSQSLNNYYNRLQDMQDFFGNSLPGMQDMFGNNINNSPWNGFNPPSGSGSPQNVSQIPRNSNPAEGACQNNQKTLSEDDAIAIAILSGLPYPTTTTTNNPLQTYYVPRESIVGRDIQGNGQPITSNQLPANAPCDWVVRYETNYNNLAIIEDTTSPNGGKLIISTE